MTSRRERLRLGLLRAFASISRPWRYSRSPRLARSPRILLIRPDHIGDLLFATPAIRTIRHALPGAYLAALVGPWGVPVLENNPWLNECLTCEFPGFARQPKGAWWAPYRRLAACASLLRLQRYDMAVILRFDHWWGAVLAYLAGIPYRVGYAIPECTPFLTHAMPYESGRHEVLQNQTLTAQVLMIAGQAPHPVSSPDDGISTTPLEFRPDAADRHYIERYLEDRGVSRQRPLVILHPGAGAPVKQWRPEAFAEVANELVRRHQATIVITGARTELDLAWTIAAYMDADPIIASGDTTLGQLAALFECAQLAVGPDSGPLHLAVAVGTPSVHLYGPVDPVKFGPWGPAAKHKVLTSFRDCIPCNRLDYAPVELPEHPCVREIAAGAVLDVAEQLLEATDTAAVIK